MNTSHRVSAALLLALAAFSWALTPIFIRFLSTAYDPITQSFLRYASAALPLVAISLIGFRRELPGVVFHKGVIGSGLVNAAMMFTWTAGCYLSTATKAQFISKLSAVFIIVFSFFLFREERPVITSRHYLLGTALSILGVTGLISKDPTSLAPTLDTGALLLLTTAVLWAVYTVWSRHVVLTCHPIAAFTMIAVYTTLACGAGCLAIGEPRRVMAVSPSLLAITVISGLIPIALGHPCYLFAQKQLGAALCSSVTLLNPLVTYMLARLIWPDEQLTPVQWAGAALLLCGTTLVMYAGRSVVIRSPG